MPSSYPTGLDAFTTGTLTGIVSGSDHGNKGDAINKIEAELGVLPSSGQATVADRIASLGINVKDHGATGNGSTDDTAAIQAAIDACAPGANTSLRYASHHLYVPPGTYKVTSTLQIHNVFGFRMTGAGQWNTRFVVSGTGMGSGTLFDLNGVPHCAFERFGVTAVADTTSHTVTNVIHIRWSGVTGSATRRTTLREIYISDLHFVNGIGVELTDVTKQNDEITIQDCTIDGGNATPGSPDATYWRTGIKIGSGGASGNTFQILILRPGIQQCRSAVHATGTSFHQYGGGFQANTFDFNVHAPWLNFSVEGLRSEQATRLLTDEVGFSGTPVSASLKRIWFNASNLNADGDLVVFKHAGEIVLDQIHCTSGTIDQYVNVSNSGLGHTVARIRGCKFRTAPGSITYGEADSRQHVIEDYVQTTADGTDTNAFFPGRVFLPVTAANTSNDTLFKDSADGKLKYKDAAGATQALY